jgi:lipoprotein-anchoring transpeptidase ErfK/SrfK
MIKRKYIFRALIILAALFVGVEIAGTAVQVFALSGKDVRPVKAETTAKALRSVEARGALLASRIKALAPRGVYIVIDTAENRLRVMQREKLLREAVVSCGSGDILEEPGGKRRWIFDTPRGEFTVNSKLVNPTWIKPDWAFIEEGEKPPKDYNERIDNDTLGAYALGIGEGFFIHGTLYTRLLGRNVTHGCVRVGDEDLKEVFRTVPMGARVYIY